MNVTLNQEEISEAIALYLREVKLSASRNHEVTMVEFYDNGDLMTMPEVKVDISTIELRPMAAEPTQSC